jgi:hypothetical protein
MPKYFLVDEDEMYALTRAFHRWAAISDAGLEKDAAYKQAIIDYLESWDINPLEVTINDFADQDVRDIGTPLVGIPVGKEMIYKEANK